jgi:hypothetical protein
MPVDAATVGGSPNPINTGLNITPPPRPTAEVNPPPKEPRTSFITMVISRYEISDSVNPIFENCFIRCSMRNLLIYVIERMAVTRRNKIHSMKSVIEHFYMPIIDGFLFEPRSKFTKKASKTVEKQSKWIRHGRVLLLSLYTKV